MSNTKGWSMSCNDLSGVAAEEFEPVLRRLETWLATLETRRSMGCKR